MLYLLTEKMVDLLKSLWYSVSNLERLVSHYDEVGSKSISGIYIFVAVMQHLTRSKPPPSIRLLFHT